MSSNQFLDIAATHSRFTFEVLNILEPIPERWRGQFDIVHLRMLLLGLTSSDWAVAARNVFDLLKPGGWIQWQEQNASSNEIFPTDGPASSVNAQRLLDAVLAVQRKASTCLPEDAPKFKERVEAGGFIECEVHRASSDRDSALRHAATVSVHVGLVSMLRNLAAGDPNSSLTTKDIDEIVVKADAELGDDKIYWRSENNTITGQKPI